MVLQQRVVKMKGIADVVFCIDFSGSMSSCIEGVKQHITKFVESLETANPNMVIDWQIGFCAYTNTDFVILPFTRSAKEFSRKLGEANPGGGDEFTAGAIDYIISSFNWRPVSNKFVVVFTDEELEGGYYDEQVTGLFPALLEKISGSRVRLFYFGPRCRYYSEFEKISRAIVMYIEDRFDVIDFSSLLTNLGKTVSQSAGQQEQQRGSYPLVFDLQHITITSL